jgi:hypothetical protein
METVKMKHLETPSAKSYIPWIEDNFNQLNETVLK